MACLTQVARRVVLFAHARAHLYRTLAFYANVRPRQRLYSLRVESRERARHSEGDGAASATARVANAFHAGCAFSLLFTLAHRQRMTLTFEHVSYFVNLGNGLRKEILHDVSGSFRAGRLTAIMGPSGELVERAPNVPSKSCMLLFVHFVYLFSYPVVCLFC